MPFYLSHKRINNSTNLAYIFEEAYKLTTTAVYGRWIVGGLGCAYWQASQKEYTRFEKNYIASLSAINIEMQLLISRRAKEKVSLVSF